MSDENKLKKKLDELRDALRETPEDEEVWRQVAEVEDKWQAIDSNYKRKLTSKKGTPLKSKLAEIKMRSTKKATHTYKIGQTVVFKYGLSNPTIFKGLITKRHIRGTSISQEYEIEVEGYPNVIIMSYHELKNKEVKED